MGSVSWVLTNIEHKVEKELPRQDGGWEYTSDSLYPKLSWNYSKGIHTHKHTHTNPQGPGRQASTTTQLWKLQSIWTSGKGSGRLKKASPDQQWGRLRNNEVRSRLLQRRGHWHPQMLRSWRRGRSSWIKEAGVKRCSGYKRTPRSLSSLQLVLSQQTLGCFSVEGKTEGSLAWGIPSTAGLRCNQKQRAGDYMHTHPSHSAPNTDIRPLLSSLKIHL